MRSRISGMTGAALAAVAVALWAGPLRAEQDGTAGAATGTTGAAAKDSAKGTAGPQFVDVPKFNPKWKPDWQIAPMPLPKPIIYTREDPPKTPALTDLPEATSVTQYGITWKFDRKVRVGQFVTNDYYIVGEATVVDIDPRPLFGDEVKNPEGKVTRFDVNELEWYPHQWARNGSTLNHPCENTTSTGLDSRVESRRYNPRLFTRLPIALKPGDSLISSISFEKGFIQGKPQPTRVAAVLTCVAEPLPPDAFRPSYVGGQKVYYARHLRRELLYNLPRPKNPPKREMAWAVHPIPPCRSILEEYACIMQKPWLDVVFFGFEAPFESRPCYGQDLVNAVSQAALLLHLDYKPQEKEPLLVNFVQYGIDLFGIVKKGAGKHEGWIGLGGHGSGRKWPLLFAGLMLGEDEMLTPNKVNPKVNFGEDFQTRMGRNWAGGPVVFRSHPHMDYPDQRPPDQWGLSKEGWQSEGYRRCCTVRDWVGQCLAARLMRAEKTWDHEAFFAEVDWWMTEDHIAELKKFVQVINDRNAGGGEPIPIDVKQYERDIRRNQYPRTNAFCQEMWNTYNGKLPPPLTPKS